MTTSVKTGSFRARVEEAQREVQTIEQKLEQPRLALTKTQARKADMVQGLREARIQEAMGGRPEQTVAALKHDLEALSEDVESAEARTVGLQRAVTSAKAELDTAKQHLRQAQLSCCEKLAPQFADRMWQDIHNAHSAQLDLIALVRTMQDLGFHPREIAHLFPRYLLFFEISSSFEAESLKLEKKAWPAFGDRRVGNDLIAGQMEEFLEQLKGL